MTTTAGDVGTATSPSNPGRWWHDLALFLVGSVALSWAYVLAYDAVLDARLTGTTFGRIAPNMGAWGPLVAVAVVVWRSDARVGDWVRRRLALRQPLRQYLFALAVPNLVSSAAMVVFPVQGVPLGVSASPTNFVLVFAFTLTLLGALEEFGWRGFLQPALQARTNPTVAALVVGATWALWHLPMHRLGYLGEHPFWLFALHLLAMSVVMAWLYNRAEGILPVMAFHAAHNAPGNVFGVARTVPPDVAATYYPVYTALWFVVAASVVAYAGPGLAADGNDATRTG